MKAFALFAAAVFTLPVAATAQSARGCSATPATAPTTDSLITRSILWKCGGTSCTAGKTSGNPLAMCRLVRQRLGPLTAFVADGGVFAPEQLDRCDAVTR